MTEKDLKRLSRPQILEMFAAYESEKAELQSDLKKAAGELEELKEQNANLQGRLTEVGAKLNNQKIELENAGSIADAAMQVNGVFEAAQKAADQYLENVKALKERQEKELASVAADAKNKSEHLLEEAQQQAADLQKTSRQAADRILSEANEKAGTIRQQADRYAADMRQQADQYASDSLTKTQGELSAAKLKKAALEKETQQNCDQMLENAKKEAEDYWNSLSSRLEGFYQDHAGLKELLGRFDLIRDQSAGAQKEEEADMRSEADAAAGSSAAAAVSETGTGSETASGETGPAEASARPSGTDTAVSGEKF